MTVMKPNQGTFSSSQSLPVESDAPCNNALMITFGVVVNPTPSFGITITWMQHRKPNTDVQQPFKLKLPSVRSSSPPKDADETSNENIESTNKSQVIVGQKEPE
jgi:hypothetical protein